MMRAEWGWWKIGVGLCDYMGMGYEKRYECDIEGFVSFQSRLFVHIFVGFISQNVC